jgi:hypothetical protein
MSDFAPFVAAALRDKTVTDLLEENQTLQDQLASFRTIRITGKDGFPVYAEQDFASGKPTDYGWVVRLPHRRECQQQQHHNTSSNIMLTTNLSQQPPIPCRMSQLAECEVHVGNFRNTTCREFNEWYFDGNPVGYFSLFATKGLWLCCFLESVTEEHYQSLCRAAARRESIRDILHHFEDPMEDLNVYFTHLTFCAGSASEAIKCLELLPIISAAPSASRREEDERSRV